MAKHVFRYQEVQYKENKVAIEAPFTEQEEVVEAVEEEYSGPTADDLKREAEAFKTAWEAERAQMIADAKDEARRIVAEAETTAFDQIKKKTDEGQVTRQQLEDEGAQILNDAKEQAKEMLGEAEERVTSITKNARDEGYSLGHDEGYDSGKQEVERLIKHLHTVISTAIEKRNEIIEESETQLVNLVLMISKKVVKVISENQKNVVINNVIQALRKLKSRGDVILRVNMEDVQLTSDHIKDFMRMIDNVRSITVMEDSTVDRGGCIIETDFGEIDARIISQFQEIEDKILELAPIKPKDENPFG